MRPSNRILNRWRLKTACSVSLIALSAVGYAVSAHSEKALKDTSAAAQADTKSPIKHVIILIGENRGLDHTFGVYIPKGRGETISNLVSKGIVKRDGSPGPNFHLSQQFAVTPQSTWYFGIPNSAGLKTPYQPSGNVMPQPNTNGAPTAQNSQFPDAPLTSFVELAAIGGETDIEAADQGLTTTGATGLPTKVLDTRVPGAGGLPPGPFVLLGPNIGDDDYTGDMTHRFYQAAQQQDCSMANATKDNPTGCLNDL